MMMLSTRAALITAATLGVFAIPIAAQAVTPIHTDAPASASPQATGQGHSNAIAPLEYFTITNNTGHLLTKSSQSGSPGVNWAAPRVIAPGQTETVALGLAADDAPPFAPFTPVDNADLIYDGQSSTPGVKDNNVHIRVDGMNIVGGGSQSVAPSAHGTVPIYAYDYTLSQDLKPVAQKSTKDPLRWVSPDFHPFVANFDVAPPSAR